MARIASQCFGPQGIQLSPLLRGTVAVDVLPPEALELAPKAYGFVMKYDTEEKLEEFFLEQPEPDPVQLDIYLEFARTALRKLGMKFEEKVKQFPRDQGGRPKRLSTPEERRRVIEDVKGLREPGRRLDDIFERVAVRYGVSASKIKQIWQEEKNR